MSLTDLILLNAKDYLDIASDVYINVIMLIVAAALSVSCFFINHHKTYTVAIIKQLLRHEAIGEENAKTLRSLRLDNSRSLKWALSRRGQLTKIVSRVGYVEPTYEEYMAKLKAKEMKKEKIDFSTALFFISKENLDRATLVRDRENPTILRTALVCVLILALTVCIMLLMPEILTLIAKVGDQ